MVHESVILNLEVAIMDEYFFHLLVGVIFKVRKTIKRRRKECLSLIPQYIPLHPTTSPPDAQQYSASLYTNPGPVVVRPHASPELSDDPFWAWVRLQYPLDYQAVIYMNTGGLGPSPSLVLTGMQGTTWYLQRLCETGHDDFQSAARQPVADFVGADVSEVCFTRNATESTSIIAAGLGLQKGDEVILSTHSHPGGSFAWLDLHKSFGVIIKLFEPSSTSSQETVNRIKALITSRTKVIQSDYVSAPTGILHPVKEIAALAQQHNCWFHIDAAQALGMFPFNFHEIGCDSLAASCHKWLGAPHETGVLLIKSSKLDQVRPVEVGAYSADVYTLPNQITWVPSAVRYEYGTRDAAKIAAIPFAIRFLQSIGMDKVEHRGRYLAQYLQSQLKTIPGVTVLTPTDPTMMCSITTYRCEKVPYQQLFSYLWSKWKLRTRPVSEANLNAVRVSTHIFNLESDCDLIVQGTKAAIQEVERIGLERFTQLYNVSLLSHN